MSSGQQAVDCCADEQQQPEPNVINYNTAISKPTSCSGQQAVDRCAEERQQLKPNVINFNTAISKPPLACGPTGTISEILERGRLADVARAKSMSVMQRMMMDDYYDD